AAGHLRRPCAEGPDGDELVRVASTREEARGALRALCRDPPRRADGYYPLDHRDDSRPDFDARVDGFSGGEAEPYRDDYRGGGGNCHSLRQVLRLFFELGPVHHNLPGHPA